MSILKFLGLENKKTADRGASADTDTVRKITESLDRLEPERARYIAAFAYILQRVAHADLHISQEETREMERILKKQGGLPEEQAILVVQLAKTQQLLFGGTEDFLVTREFSKLTSREQKMALLHCLFLVSASSDSVSVVEDNEIRQISRELRLDHKDFIDVRSAYRKHLAVLKKPPDAGE